DTRTLHSFPTRRSSDLHGADKDLEQLFAHRHGNLLRANRPTVADPNCRKQLPRLTSPFVARVFRPRGSSAKTIYKPRLQRDRLRSEEHTSELQSRGHLV